MKKRWFVIFLVLATLIPVISMGTKLRQSGMNGDYYVPDAVIDPLAVNPVLLSRMNGTLIIGDVMMDIYFYKYVEDDYLNANHSSPTNDTRTTKEKWLNFSGSQAGFLYNQNGLGLGLIIAPTSYSYSSNVVKDPNNQTNDANDLNETTETTSGVPYNSTLLFSYDIGSAVFGLRINYTSDPYLSTYTKKTNSVEDDSAKKREENKYSKISFTGGGGFGNSKDMFFGITFGYGIISGEKKPNATRIPIFGLINNYIATNNTYYLTGTDKGSEISGNILVENRMSADKLLRALADFSYTSEKVDYKASDEFKKTTGLSNMKEQNDDSTLNLQFYTSISKAYKNALTFAGFNVGYEKTEHKWIYDNDTTKAPTSTSNQFKTTSVYSTIDVSLTLGGEGAIIDWLILRGSLNSTLFSYSSIANTTVDSYDAFHSKVADTVTSDTKDTTTELFNSFSITAGATIKFSQTVNLDIASTFDVFGVNYESEKNEWDKTRNLNDTTKHNPVDTTSTVRIKINAGVSIHI